MNDQMGSVAVAPLKRQWGRTFKRVLRWAAGIILALALLLYTIVKFEDWRQFKTDLHEYQGARIGATKTDIQYALGAPQTVQGPEVADKNGWKMSTPLRVDPQEQNESIPQGYEAIPESKSALDYDDWHYWNESGTFDVTFDPKTRRVKSVTCWLPAGPARFCDWTFDLHEGTTEDEVVRLLGKPDVEKVEGGDNIPGIGVTGVTKRMEYRSLGLNLMLSKRQVTSITKVAPGGAGLGWWLAHRLP